MFLELCINKHIDVRKSQVLVKNLYFKGQYRQLAAYFSTQQKVSGSRKKSEERRQIEITQIRLFNSILRLI